MADADLPARESRFVRALKNPRSSAETALSVFRGWYYRAKWKISGQRVIVGRRFRVVGRLDIKGPGTVIFGDDCAVISSRMSPTTPWTHSPEAVIQFGNRVLLTGTRFGCDNKIVVGDLSGLSDARLMDTDFHALDFQDDRPRYNTRGRSKPIVIGRNVWVGAGAMILKGVRIGNNAVVAAGSVVVTNVPESAVVLGNPARVVTRVKSAGPSTGGATNAPPAAGVHTPS